MFTVVNQTNLLFAHTMFKDSSRIRKENAPQRGARSKKMIKKVSLVIVMVLLLAFNLSAGEAVFGEKLTVKEVTKISEINANPDKYLGKTVRIEGYITDGCHHHGAWLAIASDKEFQKIMIWDLEGKITFPLDHKGKYGIIEGVVYKKEYTEEEANKRLKHLATNHKQTVDLSKAKGGMTLYNLNATGGVVKDSK